MQRAEAEGELAGDAAGTHGDELLAVGGAGDGGEEVFSFGGDEALEQDVLGVGGMGEGAAGVDDGVGGFALLKRGVFADAELGDVEELLFAVLAGGHGGDDPGGEGGEELGDHGQEDAFHVGQIGELPGFFAVESFEFGVAGGGFGGHPVEDGRADDDREDGDDGVHGVKVGREEQELRADDRDDDVGAALKVEADADSGGFPRGKAAGACAEEAEEGFGKAGEDKDDQDAADGGPAAKLEKVDAHAGEAKEDGREEGDGEGLDALFKGGGGARGFAEQDAEDEGSEQRVEAHGGGGGGGDREQDEDEREFAVGDGGDIRDAAHGPEREASAKREHEGEEADGEEGGAGARDQRICAVLDGGDDRDHGPDDNLGGDAGGEHDLGVVAAEGFALDQELGHNGDGGDGEDDAEKEGGGGLDTEAADADPGADAEGGPDGSACGEEAGDGFLAEDLEVGLHAGDHEQEDGADPGEELERVGDGAIEKQEAEGGGEESTKDGGANKEAAEELAEDLRLAEASGELGHAARGEKEGGDGAEGAQEFVLGESMHAGSWPRAYVMRVGRGTLAAGRSTPRRRDSACGLGGGDFNAALLTGFTDVRIGQAGANTGVAKSNTALREQGRHSC